MARSFQPLIRLLVDASLDAAAIVDENLELLYFNQHYLRMSGLRRREIMRSEARAMCHRHFGFQSCDDGCVSRRAFETRLPQRVDEVDSSRFPLRVIVVAIPLLDDDGVPYAVLETYRDVTAESRMQSNYRDLLERERDQKRLLQAEVARQTLELERTNRSLRAALEEVSRVARTDGLTGLDNRRQFDVRLADLVSSARRGSQSLGIVLFDLDHFKLVNDRHGHPTGDRVLQDFARALRFSSREIDVVARIGGEEFALILPEAGLDDAVHVARRVQEQAAAMGMLTTASAGAAVLPEHGSSAAELLRAADQALYVAKDSGRNRVVTYDPARDAHGAERTEDVA